MSELLLILRRIWSVALLLLLLVCSSSSLRAADTWQELKNCKLLPNQSNDADSFHVKTGGKEYIFRLYFVDAPETEMSVAGRVEEQAKYFAITPEQTVQLGDLGKKFSQEKLAQPFTVRTCLQDARGRSQLPRYFAFIQTTEGDLGELLVANGLARVYGAAAVVEGLSSPEREWQKLHGLEEKAKGEKVGAWGVSSGRMASRTATLPAKSGADSFEAFFHPTDGDVAAIPQATALNTLHRFEKSAPGRIEPPGGQLDVNRATSKQLLQLPGVGPVLASRIVAARPLQSADDLRQVQGIGEKRYEQLRPFFK
ncbi:MAG: helix-hairpin-helix domain-containing protein [Chthoniobacterales bacterium]